MSPTPNQTRMRAAWDKEYGETHAYTTSYRGELDRGVLFLLGYLEGRGEALQEPILDCGCGIGRNALALARAGHRVIGLEHSGVALDRMHERQREEGLDDRVSTLQHDLGERLPLADSSVGTVLDVTAVDNLTDPARRRRYGEEVARVLRPGGLALVVTFAVDDGYYSRWLEGSVATQSRVVEDPNTGISNQLFTHASLESVFAPALEVQARSTLVFFDEAARERWTRRFLVHLYRRP